MAHGPVVRGNFLHPESGGVVRLWLWYPDRPDDPCNIDDPCDDPSRTEHIKSMKQ